MKMKGQGSIRGCFWSQMFGKFEVSYFVWFTLYNKGNKL